MNDIFGQFCIFSAFVFCGMVISLVYALTHFTRKYKIFFDIVFGAIAVAVVFFANLIWNKGCFRVFVFLGVALGWFVGAKTLAFALDTALVKLYNFFIQNYGKGTHNEADVDISK